MNMRRMIFTMMLGAACLCGGRFVETETLTVSSNPSSGLRNSQMTVSIGIDNAAGVAGGAFIVNFDPDVFQQPATGDVTAGSLLTGFLVQKNVGTAGQVRIAFAGSEGLPGGSGALINIVLSVKPGAPTGNSNLALFPAGAEPYLQDENYNPIATSVVDGVFTVTLPTYTITPSAGQGGAIQSNTPQIVTEGESQTFDITSNAGYLIQQLLVDGTPVGEAAGRTQYPYTFTNVAANHTISATFQIIQYTITPNAGDNGTITPNVPMLVNHGANQLFTVAANAGYKIQQLLVDGTPVGEAAGQTQYSYTFTNVVANHTIGATFEEIPNPWLAVDKTQITFQKNDTAATLIITNTGGDGLAWSLSDNMAWLTPDKTAGGPLNTGQSDVVTLTRGGGNPGDAGTITVKNTTAGVVQPDKIVNVNIANDKPTTVIIRPTLHENVQSDTVIWFEGEFTDDGLIETSIWNIRNIASAKGSDWTTDESVYYCEKAENIALSGRSSISLPWAMFVTQQIVKNGADTFRLTLSCVDAAGAVSELKTVDFSVAKGVKYGDLNDSARTDTIVNYVEGKTAIVSLPGDNPAGILVTVRPVDFNEIPGANSMVDALFDILVENLPAGSTEIRICFDLPGDHDQWWKYNPIEDSWFRYTEAEFAPSPDHPGYTRVTLTLTDGGTGDFIKGTPDGKIIDPSGSVEVPVGAEVRGGGGCFIATAAFGSYQEYHVRILRQFRDNFLLTNPAGRAFVRWYYRHSPKYAAVIAHNDGLRAAVRVCLLPAYGLAYLTLKFGLVIWLLLVAIGAGFILRRRSPAAAKLLVAAGVLLPAMPSFAVDFNHFKPAPGESQFIVNSSAQAMPKGQLRADIFYTYADKPAKVRSGGVDRNLLKEQHLMFVSEAYAFTDKFQMSFTLPALLSQSGDNVPGMVGEIKDRGLGNVTLAAKYSFCGGRDKIGFAVAPFVALPTGDADNLISSDSTAGGIRVIVDKNWNNRTFLTLNVGYWGQNKEEIGQIAVQNGVLFGAGISQVLPNGSTSLTAEIYGRSDQGGKSAPVEAILSVGQQIKWAQIVVGGGAGLTDGYGAPQYRGFVGVKCTWP